MARKLHVEKPEKRRRNDSIVRLYVDKHLTAEQIAPRFDLTPSAVEYVLRNRRVKTRIAADYDKPTPEYSLKIRRFAESIMTKVGTGPGTSVAALARKAGLIPTTVRSHLREIGFVARKGMGGARLDLHQVSKIKAALVKGVSQAALSRKYNVGTSTIGAIALEQTWTDVPWPVGSQPPVKRPRRKNRKKARARSPR
jgi:lambda repressor-like predicted transcriptional regulator